jgi:hypothetical protein
MPLLAGCQKGLDVSALNRCGHAVEARAESLPEITVNWSKRSNQTGETTS